MEVSMQRLSTVSVGVHAASIVTISMLHWFADRTVPPSLLNDASLKRRRETVWFLVHACANALIAWRTLPCVVELVLRPAALYETSDAEIAGKFPICLAIWLHLYHMMLFEMRADDVFHHGVFLPTIGIPGYVYDWGDVGNLQLFFICGVPGMVIYATIVHNRINPNRTLPEPFVSFVVNVFLRTPGILVANALLFHALRNRFLSPPVWASCIQMILAPTNAVYYGWQSLSRYVRLSRRLRSHPRDAANSPTPMPKRL